jgi:class 3 adenylate cyclase
MAFHERQLVVVLSDLARFTAAVARSTSVEIAELVDRYYRDAAAVAAEHGGDIVKHIGDSCLLVFPVERAVDAVDAVEALASRVESMAAETGLDLEMGANIHLSTVAEGQFGPDEHYDVMGMGVIHTFRMGSGAGIRISEPVYRKLPNERRAGWSKHQPPATYTRVPA